MLQILLNPGDRYSVAEMAQMAIEGGCTWLRLACRDMDDEEFRDIAADIAVLCRESGAILTFEGRADLARQLAVHGSYMTGASALADAIALRQEWGPEAILGAEVEGAQGALAAEKADLDFVQLPQCTSLEAASAIIAEAHRLDATIPFVYPLEAYDTTPAAVAAALSAAYAGVCAGSTLFDSSDPVKLIEALKA